MLLISGASSKRMAQWCQCSTWAGHNNFVWVRQLLFWFFILHLFYPNSNFLINGTCDFL